jgi:glutamate-1-semialdehyde 2,1-aminomutase
VAGRADVMRVSQACVAASLATLKVLKNGEIQRKLNEQYADLEKKFDKLAEEQGVWARLQALGGQFQVYFVDEEVRDYRTAAKGDSDRFKVFQAEMLRKGIYTLPVTLFHHGIVAAHSDEDMERILAAMRVGLQRVKKEFGS